MQLFCSELTLNGQKTSISGDNLPHNVAVNCKVDTTSMTVTGHDTIPRLTTLLSIKSPRKNPAQSAIIARRRSSISDR